MRVTDVKKRARRKAERPAEILDAAFEEFVKNGYAATRLEDVAALAGVHQGDDLFLLRHQRARVRGDGAAQDPRHFFRTWRITSSRSRARIPNACTRCIMFSYAPYRGEPGFSRESSDS